MKIIKTKKFARWAEKSKINDGALYEAAQEIKLDIYKANYGSGVIKNGLQIKAGGRVGVLEP